MTAANPRRDPFVDAVRVTAVWVVVIGHWTVTSVYWDDDGTRVVNALSVVPWVRASTWLTQVMPLLFFAGGFANAVVARRHEADYPGYLRERTARLVTPLIPLFALWAAVGFASSRFDLPRAEALEHAAFVAAIPLWFLGIYLIVITLAPPMVRADARFGLFVPAMLLAGAVAGDLAIHGAGMTGLAPLNYAFVWLLAHQLGIRYHSGGLSGRAMPWAMAVAGIIALVVLTSAAGYPVSMVGVPGETRWNTDPPSLAIVALTVWLIGLALLLRPAITRWGVRHRRTLAGAQRRVLTAYLWHVPAMSVAVLALYPAFPQPETGTSEWWMWRPVWLAAVGLAMVALIALFRRFETRAAPVERTGAGRAHVVGALLGVLSVAIAVLGVAVTGFSDPTGGGRALLDFRLNAMSNLIHFTLGVLLLAWALRGRRPGPAVSSVAAIAFLAAGVVGLVAPETFTFLAWNQATAALHTVIGAIALGALATILAVTRLDNAR